MSFSNTSELKPTRLRHAGNVVLWRVRETGAGGEKVASRDGQVALEIEFLRNVADSCIRGPSHRPVVRDRADQCAEENRLPRPIRSDDRQG